MKLFIRIIFILTITTSSLFSQDQENKWVIGIGSNAIDFFPSNGIGHINGNYKGFGNELFNVNDHWNQFGLPKINITRHIWKGLSLGLAYSKNKITKMGDNEVDDLPYSSIDFSLQYSILKDNSTYYPYLILGAGNTSIDKKSSLTINSGLGFTYWFADQFGVNGDAIYKYAELDYPTVQHFHYSLSLVYRFGGRGGNGKGTACFD